MRIVYTCPECGADLDEVILATYPPKYKKYCTKCGWSYIEDNFEEDIVRIPFRPTPTPLEWTKVSEDNIPSCCRRCSNHPRNGGSGICHCTLPYMTSSGDVISYGGRIDGEIRFDSTSL